MVLPNRIYKLCGAALAGAVLTTAALTLPARADAPLKVVATIKPIHSIAASVMQGVAEPQLLLQGVASPHSYALKPSDAKALSEADVVIRVSENLEVFLEKAIKTLPEKARIVTLEGAPGLTLLPVREDEDFEAHEHGHEHEHAGHDDHKGHDHEHDEAHGDKHAHDDHEGHDVHFWLDPVNGAHLADYIAAELSKAAPDHAEQFKANAEKLKGELSALNTELSAKLAPIKGKPFVVFHDVMQYFENRFALKAAGAITVSPERQPGAKRLSEIKSKIEKLGAVCVFAEPQFPPKLVDTLIDGTRAKKGTLDEVGVEAPAGPGQYAAALRQNAESLFDCLSSERS